jgi:glutamyl-tRNA synthetase
VGGVRTTLFNWLFARKNKGAFILRIEDTDKERSKREYEDEILEMLEWLGLDYDEGPALRRQEYIGAYGPYRQSERTKLYQEHLETLLRERRAYYCYCTKEELEAERQTLLSQGLPPKYGGHCRALTSPPQGKSPQVIRFLTPEAHVEFKDLIRGKMKFDAGLFGDFVIAKDIRTPLYNFAVVVDDELMRITHVIRGEEHLPNTPRQILMQKALGFAEPAYAHLPLILASDRSKLSKRYAETSLLEYREKGFVPQALLNFLALLGWHPSGDREFFTLKELVDEFDLARIQKAGAVFNEEKLLWLNREHLRRTPDAELRSYLAPFLGKMGITADARKLDALLALERGRMQTLAEFTEHTRFFFELPEYSPKLLVWREANAHRTRETLEATEKALEAVPENSFSREIVSGALAPLAEQFGKGNVLWPLRVALSGQAASPDPLDIATILGKAETLRRVKLATQKITNS